MSDRSAFKKRRRSVAQRRASISRGQPVSTLRENNYQLAKRLEETEQSLNRNLVRNVDLQRKNSELVEELAYMKAEVEELARRRAVDMVRTNLKRYSKVCGEVSRLLSTAVSELETFGDIDTLLASSDTALLRESARGRLISVAQDHKENQGSVASPVRKSTAGVAVRKKRRKPREIQANEGVNVMVELKEESESAMKMLSTPTSAMCKQVMVEDSASPCFERVCFDEEGQFEQDTMPSEGDLTLSQRRPRREISSVDSYAEPSLSKKLRRGDKFTESHPEYEEMRCFQGSRSCSTLRVAKRRLSAKLEPPKMLAECWSKRLWHMDFMKFQNFH